MTQIKQRSAAEKRLTHDKSSSEKPQMSPGEKSMNAFTGVALMKESNHCTVHALTRLPALLHLNVFFSSYNSYLLLRKDSRRSFRVAVSGGEERF